MLANRIKQQQEQINKRNKDNQDKLQNIPKLLEEFFTKELDAYDRYLEKNPQFKKTYIDWLPYNWYYINKNYKVYKLTQKQFDQEDMDELTLPITKQQKKQIEDFLQETFGESKVNFHIVTKK